MLRGLVFAAVMVVIRLIQGAVINAWATQAGLVSLVLVLGFVIIVAVWGVIDGRADATASPDPDRRQDLAMVWLLAGLLAGVLSGAVSSAISQFYDGLYTGGVIAELTTFAAFTALVVFLPGIIGVALGRWRVDRNPPARREGGSEDQRADTDVFSAARADDAPTGELPVEYGGAQPAERTKAPTALAEREAPTTETMATTDHAANTDTAATDAAKTEVIPTHPEPKQAWPGSSATWQDSETPKD